MSRQLTPDNTSGDGSDEDTIPSWEEQLSNFPTRLAHTETVQDWLELFLERRTFNEEEINDFLQEVRLDGEDLHALSEEELRDCLPKNQEDSVLDSSNYQFEQMRRHLLTDIIRARKEVGIKVPKVHTGFEIVDILKSVPALRDIMISVMIAFAVMIGSIVTFVAILIWGRSLDDERD
ncbi:hypothetical protein PG996_008578 [Apiospora saccharicola]|uniref:Uncharacterized protein n=1 Tax=Apiospora saccharicola TaxID=335842 RepID=A0ABR1UYB3_9PEZI